MSAGLIAGIVVAALLAELLLFWAAGALADAPETGWGRFVAVPVSIGVVSGGLIVLCFYFLGVMESPLSPDKRLSLYFAGGLALLLSFIVPAVLFGPFLSVSLPRSALIAVMQFLLRIFLYVLIAAVVFVVLAIIQIMNRADKETAEGARPRPAVVTHA